MRGRWEKQDCLMYLSCDTWFSMKPMATATVKPNAQRTPVSELAFPHSACICSTRKLERVALRVGEGGPLGRWREKHRVGSSRSERCPSP